MTNLDKTTKTKTKTAPNDIFFPICAVAFICACIVILNICYRSTDYFIKETSGPTETTYESSIADLPKININTASAAELTTLKGIGEALANRIIEYREKYGDFADIREIMSVSGIGESVFGNIKDLISV